MQFPEIAMGNVTEFVKKEDPDFLPELGKLYSQVQDIRKTSRGQRDRSKVDFGTWYAAALSVYEHVKENQPAYAEAAGEDRAAWVVQDANVVVQAAEAGMPGKRSRDESMAENLAWILDHRPAGTRIVTWAHNGHVSRDLRFYASMGHFLDEKYGDEQIVFGFAFHEGEYTAYGDKGLNAYGTTASEPGSVEWFLKESGMSKFFLDLRKASSQEKGSRWLLEEMDFRSIGAGAIEYAFSPRRVRDEFDILIYFDKSTPSDCFVLTGR
jgi:erythromycin esterase-like protein